MFYYKMSENYWIMFKILDYWSKYNELWADYIRIFKHVAKTLLKFKIFYLLLDTFVCKLLYDKN